jgi:8-oxo-dGTP pyrophosphatase MutT (NUDIX family)
VNSPNSSEIGTGAADAPDIRTIASSVVYEDSWMALRRDEVERRDGTRGTYAVVDKPDFVVVIPADGDRFCLVEEYRYPIRRRSWSFPQGAFPGRSSGDPLQLARLELAQETGLRARSLTLLGFLHSAHGTIAQGYHVYLATGLTEGIPDREAEEQDMLHAWVTRPQFRDMILNADITDDSTVAAYSLLLLHEQDGASEGAGRVSGEA